jgi:GGDEF domain-containing protein
MNEMNDLKKKIDPGLATALGAMRSQVKAGAIDPEHFKRITSEIFTDPMTGMGNKKAYADFLTRPRPGVHVRIDGNDFGDINKVHGFEAGDGAIKAMGTAIREALHGTVGKARAKSYRLGGDEFHLHVPDVRSASRFARAVREKLESIAPVGGTHGLSLSMGFGHDPTTAEMALINAKTAKKTTGYKPGQARTHAHSLVPGAEGAIPVENTVKPALAPPTVTTPPAPEQIAKAQRALKTKPPPAPKAPTKAKAPEPAPILAYRGEHGPDASPGKWQTRLPSLSFAHSQKIAEEYAHEPNDRTNDSHAVAPRVISAHLRISKPWINDPDDPFVDLSHIKRTLGHDRAMWVAREFGDHIANTNAWEETAQHYDAKYDEPEEVLRRHPEAMDRLCVMAFPLLDHPEFVEHLKQAGYDGAVHAGMGVNHDEPEYRVFDHSQATPVSVTKAERPAPAPASEAPVIKAEPPPAPYVPPPPAAVLKAEDIASIVAQTLEKMTPKPAPPAPAAPPKEDAPEEVEFIRDDEGRVTGARLVRKK